MNTTLKPKTQRFLELRMGEGGYSSPDDAIRIALELLEGETFEELDPRTLASIARAEVQAERGEGVAVEEAFLLFGRKHCGS